MGYERGPALDEPMQSFGRAPSPYAAYADIDRLHEMQHPRTDEPAEMSFIVATQVMELLFGQLRREWAAAQRALRADDLPAAMDALRRGLLVQDVLTSSWDLVQTMTPQQFSAFRDQLGAGSGVQSAMYRELEFVLGNKSAGMARMQAGSPAAHARLTAALHEPGLYDDVLALLHRRGLPVPLDVLERDLTQPYEPRAGVEKAWRMVYGSEHEDLERLAELLVDVAEKITRWRQRHYAMVRRTMGGKPGTGGSSGLVWLRKAIERDVFPELWSVRDEF